jgi:hypothetical protein
MSLGKSRSPLLFVLCLSLSHFSLSRPVFIQESVFESSMADSSRAAFLQARQCWPERGREELTTPRLLTRYLPGFSYLLMLLVSLFMLLL